MPEYVLVDVETTDDAARAEYRGRSLRVIEAYGGRLMARGDVVESTAGELTSRRRMLALEFPTLEQASIQSSLVCKGYNRWSLVRASRMPKRQLIWA